jgi:predicted signal transduction protein with EAL and GGDEF domain
MLREPGLSKIPDTQVSVSIGIATAPEHVTTLELLVAAAEAAKNTAQHTAEGVALYSQSHIAAATRP